MRIVGGKFAGTDLVSPRDFRVRPTAENVRAGIMTMLAGDLQNARMIDLFAGTGAVGLEAMSRGARSCDFVEFRPSSLHALKANVAKLHLVKKTRIFKKDALPFAAMLKRDSYDIAFCDPPYESRMLDRVIDHWKMNRFSRILIVEHALGHELPRGKHQRTFDEQMVTMYVQPPKPLIITEPTSELLTGE
jgi:16S rRNA (guanine966-N2)-methyltransferase